MILFSRCYLKSQMEIPKTQIISDSHSPHLIVDSTPHTPSSITSTASSIEPQTRSPPTESPTNSPEHLNIVSSPESPSKTETNTYSDKTKSPSPLANSPDRLSVSSDHADFTHGSSPRENNSPASPTEYLTGERTPAMEPVVGRSVHEEPMALTRMDPGMEYGRVEEGGDRGGGGRILGESSRRTTRPSLLMLRKAQREKFVKRVGLGFRVFGCLFCLVSFSVMAADKNMGWALDSFYRYKEFRYSISVNAIGFIYSAAQAFDLVYLLAVGNSIVQNHFRYHTDFAIDQTISYLLISASSSATTRIDDWQSNWGKDKFPDMATASASMSFLAFLALSFSSLISGYTLCTSKSM